MNKFSPGPPTDGETQGGLTDRPASLPVCHVVHVRAGECERPLSEAVLLSEPSGR